MARSVFIEKQKSYRTRAQHTTHDPSAQNDLEVDIGLLHTILSHPSNIKLQVY